MEKLTQFGRIQARIRVVVLQFRVTHSLGSLFRQIPTVIFLIERLRQEITEQPSYLTFEGGKMAFLQCNSASACNKVSELFHKEIYGGISLLVDRQKSHFPKNHLFVTCTLFIVPSILYLLKYHAMQSVPHKYRLTLQRSSETSFVCFCRSNTIRQIKSTKKRGLIFGLKPVSKQTEEQSLPDIFWSESQFSFYPKQF